MFSCNPFARVCRRSSFFKSAASGIFLSFFGALAAQSDSLRSEQLDAVEVSATRIGQRTPLPFELLRREDLRARNLGQDLPILLDQTPSVVTDSDAGGGIGYTGLRIRGSDGTRINVSINGVPINDAESQGVFWVNMPDLVSSAEDIQIQRGAGSSTNGAGAFGASINIRTNAIRREPYAEISNSIGSFAARRHSLSFGTGLIGGRFIAEGRLAQISSDGYIDRASARLRAYFLTLSWLGDKTLLRFNTFGGTERTYQAWGGVPITFLQTQPTYNPYTYDNEVDDYAQTHYQLHATRYLNPNFTANISLHYTRGAGFFEQYRKEEDLSGYGLENLDLGDTLISSSDLIRRRWLDNHFYGFVYSLQYERDALQILLGGGWNEYRGAHFGEVIWAQYASNGNIRHRYYDNDARKLDGNTFLKATYSLNSTLSLYADLQHRMVNYSFLGFDNDLQNVEQQAQLHFFNPKAGINFAPDDKNRFFLSFSTANREPNRRDYTESTPSSRPKAERLYDLELGYERGGEKYSFSANVYGMYYRNQLVLNGQINDVGAFIRTNVDKSYRAGLELQARAELLPFLRLHAHASLSQNKILAYTEYVDDWDTGAQIRQDYQNTDIAFSPRLIAGGEITLFKHFGREEKPHAQGIEISWLHKYVSKQYLDNTQSSERALAGFWRSDLRIIYTLQRSFARRLDLNFSLCNLFNRRYAPNGFVYRYHSAGFDPTADDPYSVADSQSGFYNLIGLYPQAGTHFLLGLTLSF